MDTHSLTVELVDVDKLFCSPSNPRINEPAVPHVADSIRRFGWQQPIVAKRNGEVIAGNTRLKAAKSLGHDRVPVAWFDGTDLDATAYQVADNRTGEFAEWDEGALAVILTQLRDEDALDAVGYSSADIDDLLEQLSENKNSLDLEDPGAIEPEEQPVSRNGDLWLLGDHRLLCGDSTDRTDVERVMAGETAALVATDPPYLVDYTGKRANGCGKDWTADYREIDIREPEEFFLSTFQNVKHVLAPHAPIYCWHAHKRQPLIAQVWEELGLHLHQQIIWVKPSSVFGASFWHFRHEPCLMGWAQGSMPPHDGSHEHDSVWEVDWEGKARVVGNEHPTTKPVELFRRPMRRHTKKGAVCFEPFSGSGSQLIAATELGRRCYAIEISPRFVDVAIRRWESATGRHVILDGDGSTFDAIAEERQESAHEGEAAT